MCRRNGRRKRSGRWEGGREVRGGRGGGEREEGKREVGGKKSGFDGLLVICVCVVQFLKQEEVGEQIRLNQWQMSHRSSLLATMLHHTIQHPHSSCNGTGTGNRVNSRTERIVQDTGVR